jgi:hypothetical protein
MYYYKFAKRTNGTLKYIFKVNDKHNINFNDGCVYYSENDIEKVKDLFTVSKMRIVKNGKTWLNYILNK